MEYEQWQASVTATLPSCFFFFVVMMRPRFLRTYRSDLRMAFESLAGRNGSGVESHLAYIDRYIYIYTHGLKLLWVRAAQSFKIK